MPKDTDIHDWRDDTAYSGAFLWVPRPLVNVTVLESCLSGELQYTKTHIGVPRELLDRDKLSVPVMDLYADYEFPKISILPKSELWDSQILPFYHMVERRGGILNLACGKGKTIVAIHAIAFKGVKSLIVIDKMSIMVQWKRELLAHLNIQEADIGWVQGAKWKWKDQPIVIASLSTLRSRAEKGNLPEGFTEAFGLVIYDECHHLSAPGFSKTCPLFFGERHGLSATPKREDGMESIFLSHLGGVYYSDTSQELIPDTTIIRSTVRIESTINADLEELATARRQRRAAETCILDSAGEIHHKKLCIWLGQHNWRNNFILNEINRLSAEGHHILALTHSKEHAKDLSALLSAGLATGDVPPEERIESIKRNKVSFATIDVASEALNVPSLSALIVMTPFGAREQGNILQQAFGRIQRIHKEKILHPVVIIVEDSEVDMCRHLVGQLKRKLKEWGYPFKYKGNSREMRTLKVK